MDSWKEVPNNYYLHNCKWIPFSNGFRFSQLSLGQKQIVNHFEHHHEITTKDLLFKNVKAYAELNKINVFDHLPLTFIIYVDAQSYSSDLERFAKCYEIIDGITQAANKNSPEYYKASLKLINSNILHIGLTGERRSVTHCKPKIADTHYAGKNIWILKPTGFIRGRGEIGRAHV